MPDPERDQQPWVDELVAEVRAARERLLADCDHDLRKLVDRLRAAQEASGRPVVSYPRRKPPAKPVPA
jgi:hypothetical protein